MADPSIFEFGIEIELLIESPKQKHKTWKDLANGISATLTKAGIPTQVDTTGDYTQWSIVKEVTVQNDKNPYHYGIELVSPIHTADSLLTGALHAILTRIFTHLPHIIPSTSCSSHIHISRVDKPLNHLDLAALGKAALYFETALDALLPPSRRTTPTSSTYWSQSLRSSTNPSLAGLTLLPCLDKIDAAAAEGSMRAVVEVLNLHSKSTTYAVVKGKTAHFIRGKTYKWDFSGLLSETAGEREGVTDCGIEGTVEFRQPPGSGNAEEAVGWAVLGVAFVAGAVAVGGGLGIVGGELREEGGSVRELWRLLQRGREVVGWRDLEAIKGLFWRAGEQV